MSKNVVEDLAAKHDLGTAITTLEVAISAIINAATVIQRAHSQATDQVLSQAFENFQNDLEKTLLEADYKKDLQISVNRYSLLIGMLKLMKKDDSVFLIAQKLQKIKEYEASLEQRQR